MSVLISSEMAKLSSDLAMIGHTVSGYDVVTELVKSQHIPESLFHPVHKSRLHLWELRFIEVYVENSDQRSYRPI